MSSFPANSPTPALKAPYSAPVLERFGSVSEQTRTKQTLGRMDGAPMNARTG